MAQQTTQTPPAAAPTGAAKTEGDKDPPIQLSSKPQNDRIFWALPNFLTVENASQVPPLTAGQKFKLEARSTFDPIEYPYVAMVTLINQVSDSEPTFGRGFRGYARRYGTAFADNTAGNFGTGAVFPALVHQDPRYYQLGKGGFFHRVVYAGSRIFITRTDSGQRQFNYSEFLGNALAGALAPVYHPAPRTLVNSVSIWWTQIGWDAASYELKEFWPDIKHYIRRR